MRSWIFSTLFIAIISSIVTACVTNRNNPDCCENENKNDRCCCDDENGQYQFIWYCSYSKRDGFARLCSKYHESEMKLRKMNCFGCEKGWKC